MIRRKLHARGIKRRGAVEGELLGESSAAQMVMAVTSLALGAIEEEQREWRGQCCAGRGSRLVCARVLALSKRRSVLSGEGEMRRRFGAGEATANGEASRAGDERTAVSIGEDDRRELKRTRNEPTLIGEEERLE